MKLITFSALFLFSISQHVIGQTSLEIELLPKKKEVLFLNFVAPNDLKYDLLQSEYDFTLSVNSKKNNINVYMEWLNPLRYKLTWKDSLIDDERYTAVNTFMELLKTAFAADLNILSSPGSGLPNSTPVTDSTEILGRNYHDKDLLLWLIHFRSNKSHFTPPEIRRINSLALKIKALDDSNNINISTLATKIYSALFNYSTLSDLNGDIANQEEEYSFFETHFTSVTTNIKKINDELSLIKINDEMLQSYLSAVINNYLIEVESKMKTNKIIVSKLKIIIDIIKASTNNKSKNMGKTEHFYNRSIEFEDGKKMETTLNISEYEFIKDSLSYKKKDNIFTKSFTFKKYDIFQITSSTGIFYGNVTLNGFGIANNTDGSFKITEDNVSKGLPVTAIFLNINFAQSDYFSPIIQLGLDPTKKRPFLLFGAGFSIPAARIAFSGGPIWTWNQTLDTLTVGQSISSTTELETDIKYQFEIKPKGWYLGIQYNLSKL